MAYSYSELERRSVNGPDGLRTIARERFRALGLPTTWIIKGQPAPCKDDLIDAIMQGAIPMQYQDIPDSADAETETETPKPERKTGNTPQDLASVIAQAVQQHLHIEAPKPALDTEAVKALVQAEIKAALVDTVKRVEVKAPDGTIQNVGAQHKRFPELLAMISANVPVWLVGPSASGKTHAAESAAAALGLSFHCVSVCQQTAVSYLLGYMNASGGYVSTEFRKAYETGGVFLLDEIDAGNPNVLAVLNAALSNSVCAFPDGMISRHADFRCIAAANTFGRGADRQYVGRLQIDAATLNRFAILVWDYDEALEREIGGNAAWTKYVQAVRRTAAELQLRVVISPRASIYGARMLSAGMQWNTVADSLLFAGMDSETVEKIKNRTTAAAECAA